MIESSGKNNFNGKFDSFEWNAPYYETPKEVIEALLKIPCIGKKVKSLKVIGSAFNVEQSNNEDLLIEKIEDAGMELPGEWWDTYPFLDKIRVPWEVEACEPFQIIFDDDTTLEIQPLAKGAARIAFNSIPIEIKDGLNYSNFNADLFFKEIIGLKLKEITLRFVTTSEQYFDKYMVNDRLPYEYIRYSYELLLTFEDLNYIKIINSWESIYRITCMTGLNDEQKVQLGIAKKSILKNNNVTIYNGRGGAIWICPLCLKSDNKQKFFDNYGMSVDDIDISEFLCEFLYKYYDPNIQEIEEYETSVSQSFDWYGVNLYSLQSIRNMIQDIKKTIELLRENPDDESLIKIKDHFSTWRFSENVADSDIHEDEISLKKKNIPIAIDFYERFTKRLESMISLPGIDTVSFAGP